MTSDARESHTHDESDFRGKKKQMHLVVMVINAQHVLSTALRQENSMANTRLHSAAAASNWSCSTTLNWSSFETLGSNKYNTLGKELILWKHTHHMCVYIYIYISFLPQREFLSLSTLSFSPVYEEDLHWFLKRPLADVVQTGMLRLFHGKHTQTGKTVKMFKFS